MQKYLTSKCILYTDCIRSIRVSHNTKVVLISFVVRTPPNSWLHLPQSSLTTQHQHQLSFGDQSACRCRCWEIWWLFSVQNTIVELLCMALNTVQLHVLTIFEDVGMCDFQASFRLDTAWWTIELHGWLLRFSVLGFGKGQIRNVTGRATQVDLMQFSNHFSASNFYYQHGKTSFSYSCIRMHLTHAVSKNAMLPQPPPTPPASLHPKHQSLESRVASWLWRNYTAYAPYINIRNQLQIQKSKNLHKFFISNMYL